MFSNTHEAAVRAIHTFIGAGHVRSRDRSKTKHKTIHQLVISRVDDLRRVIPELIPRTIIKQAGLVRLLDFICDKKTPPNWDRMATVDPGEVRTLYWVEEQSLQVVCQKYGVKDTAVMRFMRKHGIALRTRSEANRLAVRKGRR